MMFMIVSAEELSAVCCDAGTMPVNPCPATIHSSMSNDLLACGEAKEMGTWLTRSVNTLRMGCVAAGADDQHQLIFETVAQHASNSEAVDVWEADMDQPTMWSVFFNEQLCLLRIKRRSNPEAKQAALHRQRICHIHLVINARHWQSRDFHTDFSSRGRGESFR
jgi:hypothetical protein